MKHLRTARFWGWTAALFMAQVIVLVAFGALLVLTLPADERASVPRWLESAAPALAYGALLLLAACGALVHAIFDRYSSALRRLGEQIKVLIAAGPAHKVGRSGAREVTEVAELVNRVADRWSDAISQSASAGVADGERLRTERDQFAALLSELAEGVIVCNAAGQVLLFNTRATELLAAGPSGESAGALLGLGRSIFSVLDREQVAHALDKVRRRFDAEAGRPQTRFVVASLAGSAVHVRLAPYVTPAGEFAGLVMTLSDAGEAGGDESAAGELLQSLAAAIDASLARVRATIEALARAPAANAEPAFAVDALTREVTAMKRQLDGALSAFAGAMARAITLEEVRADDLLAIAEARLKELGVGATAEAVADDLWLRADSFRIVQAIAGLAARVRDDYAVRVFRLRATREASSVALDLVWRGTMMASETLAHWHDEALQGSSAGPPLTLRQVMDRHGGSVAYQADRPRQDAWIRLALPAIERTPAPALATSAQENRPEFYDFELFADREPDRELPQRSLASLAYTVFDTETTGLEPSAGDEIVSIGAVRIVNSRLLRREVFEQIVDPRRRIDRASTRLHGIDAAAVAGQPTIEVVLPRFHRFCEGTVLVAHNAAFDMRFLSLKESATGTRFDHFVLDTLLLSAIVFAHQESHDLDALAQRFAVPVIGRHTALGDALLTGEVFLRLMPLLAERGIVTLAHALDASRATRLARLQY